jgi:hypothetical protein
MFVFVVATPPKSMTEQRLYILMRTDLESMGPGRACAMASHATNAFMKSIGNNLGVKDWQKETKQGFGTCIVLGCELPRFNEVMESLKSARFFCDKVVDPDYCITVSKEIFSLMDPTAINSGALLENGKVVVSRSETTCAWVFGPIEDLKPFLQNLPLYG